MRGGGVQINMRRMNETTLGPDGATAVAGGGVMQYQITAALAAHNKRAGMFESRPPPFFPPSSSP